MVRLRGSSEHRAEPDFFRELIIPEMRLRHRALNRRPGP